MKLRVACCVRLTEYSISGCFVVKGRHIAILAEQIWFLGSYLVVGNCECDSGTLVTFQGLHIATVTYLAN